MTCIDHLAVIYWQSVWHPRLTASQHSYHEEVFIKSLSHQFSLKWYGKTRAFKCLEHNSATATSVHFFKQNKIILFTYRNKWGNKEREIRVQEKTQVSSQGKRAKRIFLKLRCGALKFILIQPKKKIKIEARVIEQWIGDLPCMYVADQHLILGISYDSPSTTKNNSWVKSQE